MGLVRSFLSIVRATALEILSEPLTLLVLLSALALAVFAPAFHYHQFGEATRMARDAGLSALFVCGGVIAVFGTIRTFRREIESGTMEMALSHPVSRGRFFLAKVAGAAAAFLAFAAVVILVSFTIVTGAAIGGELAAQSGDIARLWGPSFAAGVAVIVLPLFLGAVLNRFARMRFVLSAFVLAAAFAVLAGLWSVFRGMELALRLLPVFLAALLPSLVLLSAAAAVSTRLKANASASCVAILFLLLLPMIGNCCFSDALSNGGRVPWTAIGVAVGAAAPALLFFALLGVYLINGRDKV